MLEKLQEWLKATLPELRAQQFIDALDLLGKTLPGDMDEFIPNFIGQLDTQDTTENVDLFTSAIYDFLEKGILLFSITLHHDKMDDKAIPIMFAIYSALWEIDNYEVPEEVLSELSVVDNPSEGIAKVVGLLSDLTEDDILPVLKSVSTHLYLHILKAMEEKLSQQQPDLPEVKGIKDLYARIALLANHYPIEEDAIKMYLTYGGKVGYTLGHYVVQYSTLLQSDNDPILLGYRWMILGLLTGDDLPTIRTNIAIMLSKMYDNIEQQLAITKTLNMLTTSLSKIGQDDAKT